MSSRDLQEITIAGISSDIKRGEVSPVELTDRYLKRIHELNPSLNAYMTMTDEQAMSDAKKAEDEIRGGMYRGPLHGIPFAIKDNLALRGVRTTAGSKILVDWVPDFDATVVEKFREAGAILLGKTNMHEWAGGGTTMNPFYGTTCNPWDRKRISGGSSGGSAAAVAGHLCLTSVGTDNAGSVRNPASLCGVIGLKATYGRVSRFGGVAGTGGFSTDHFGIFTKTVEDAALVLQTIAGHDPRDPLSSGEPVPDYAKEIGEGLGGLTAGLIKGYFDQPTVSEVREAFARAVELFEALGVKVREIEIPHMDLVPAVQTCTSRTENVAAHVSHLKNSPRDYSPSMLYRHVTSLMIPAATYLTAQRVRRVLCKEFDEALRQVDFFLTPTLPFPAPTQEECRRGFMEADGKRINLEGPGGNLGTRFTMPFNITGLPTLSLLCGFTYTGLPIGMQIACPSFQEGRMFRVAHAYERKAGWFTRKPPLP